MWKIIFSCVLIVVKLFVHFVSVCLKVRNGLRLTLKSLFTHPPPATRKHFLVLTLSLWRGKKYDSSGVSTFLYYFCKSQSKVSKIPHNALLSISDLDLDNWELWDHPFNHSRVGWGQISPFAINQLYDPHTSKRWHRKWQNSLFSIKIIQKNPKKL